MKELLCFLVNSGAVGLPGPYIPSSLGGCRSAEHPAALVFIQDAAWLLQKVLSSTIILETSAPVSEVAGWVWWVGIPLNEASYNHPSEAICTSSRTLWLFISSLGRRSALVTPPGNFWGIQFRSSLFHYFLILKQGEYLCPVQILKRWNEIWHLNLKTLTIT